MASTNGRAKRYTEADFRDFAHAGPGTLAGRYLRRFWQPIYRCEDLPPGRAKPIRVVGEDFTLYRGETGAPHLLDFRCAHRGTQLSTGWVEGEALRCFYHGWTYNGMGQCIEQPAEPKPFCEKVRIGSYPVQDYLGLIFAYLGEGEAPPFPRLPEFEREGVIVTVRNTWPCNYFQFVENACDPVHIAFAHRESALAASGLHGVPMVHAEETEYGLVMGARRPSEAVRTTHILMPNCQYIKLQPTDPAESDWRDFISWRVPVDDEHTVHNSISLAHVSSAEADGYRQRRAAQLGQGTPAQVLAERVLRGEVRIDEIDERGNIVNVQDYTAVVGQGAMAPRERDRLGKEDVSLILLRKIWSRELRALAEGQPLKEWRHSQGLVVTSGAA